MLFRSKLDETIKWTRAVKNDFIKGITYTFDASKVTNSFYRPYVKKNLYYDKNLNEMQYQMPQIIQSADKLNNLICFTVGGRLDFASFATNCIPSLTVLSLDANQCLPFYRYDETGNRTDNITDWGSTQFITHYGSLAKPITKLEIFHYVYAVLHDPIYREKYALNLKREFPRVPFYADFWQWADWGSTLMDAHIGYETAEPYALTRTNKKVAKPKAKLKADKENGLIILDEATTLSGVPAVAWDYKLGNRSALEWVLDQYKESKPKDPTIREKFNTYQFANYKEHVIDLLMRVCTVSIKTQQIIELMKILPR